MKKDRLQNEVEHGKFLVEKTSGKYWYWESPAGRKRWARRTKMLTAHLTPDMQVLEVGCGSGYFTKEIAKTGASITAIDISPDLLEVARTNIPSKNVNFKVENAYKLSYSPNTFDSVIGGSILHHLEVKEALREFLRVLKPGGIISFTEPNMLNPQVFVEKNVGPLKKFFNTSPDETAFIRWRIRDLFQIIGFTDILIQPFDFLHPAIPSIMVPTVEKIGNIVEKIPLLKEISGSLYMRARKPHA